MDIESDYRFNLGTMMEKKLLFVQRNYACQKQAFSIGKGAQNCGLQCRIEIVLKDSVVFEFCRDMKYLRYSQSIRSWQFDRLFLNEIMKWKKKLQSIFDHLKLIIMHFIDVGRIIFFFELKIMVLWKNTCHLCIHFSFILFILPGIFE